MIELLNVTKVFGDKVVVDNVSATFESSKITFIIGGSGVGKTTLLKCMVGLLEPEKGSILFDGVDFSTLNFTKRSTIRKNLGMLFQNGALFDSLSVQDNMLFPMLIRDDGLTKKEKEKRVDYCLERVGLDNINHLFPAELSGGMRKRVGIARAIILNPKYLFVDEPNSGLDPKNALLIDNLIYDLTKDLNITTIVISHDMNSVLEASEYVYFMHEGRIEWEGERDAVLTGKNKALNEFIFSRKAFTLLKEKL